MPYIAKRCRLLDLMRQHNVDRAFVCERLDMSRSQLSDYINNRRVMSMAVAKEFGDLFDCIAEDLYEWTHVHKSRRRPKGGSF